MHCHEQSNRVQADSDGIGYRASPDLEDKVSNYLRFLLLLCPDGT